MSTQGVRCHPARGGAVGGGESGRLALQRSWSLEQLWRAELAAWCERALGAAGRYVLGPLADERTDSAFRAGEVETSSREAVSLDSLAQNMEPKRGTDDAATACFGAAVSPGARVLQHAERVMSAVDSDANGSADSRLRALIV
jgi:hypothetical protein